MTDLRTPRVAIRSALNTDEAGLTALFRDRAALGAVPDPVGGTDPAPATSHVWRQTLAIQVVELVATGEVVGACRLHDVDARAGIGWFDVHALPAVHGSGVGIEGCLLFLQWAFDTWDLRWLCLHALRSNWPRFASMMHDDAAHHFGTLRERVIVNGQPEDVEVVGIDRDQWRTSPVRRRLLGSIARASAGS